jgi:hypothetical protein
MLAAEEAEVAVDDVRRVTVRAPLEEPTNVAVEVEADMDDEDRMTRAMSGWSLEDTAAGHDADELATIRVRTMFGLVEELNVRDGQLARVLYLTNMQAQLFDADTVPKMLGVFEVPAAPSLVINLMQSGGYPIAFQNLVDKAGLNEQERTDFHDLEMHNILGHTHSFRSREDATVACRRLTNFFKEVLLPLAAETNALVRARPWCISALSVSHTTSVLYGNFVWGCRALNSRKRFSARADTHERPESRPERRCCLYSPRGTGASYPSRCSPP